jgi:hypothetical protein
MPSVMGAHWFNTLCHLSKEQQSGGTPLSPDELLSHCFLIRVCKWKISGKQGETDV